MGFLIGLAAKAVGKRLAPLVAYGIVFLAVAGAVLWLRADAYRDGAKATDAKWVAAGAALERKAHAAATEADERSAERVRTANEQLAREKEKLDEAEALGTSPLDVLFGG